MSSSLTFLGANRNVTGSSTLLTCGGKRLLIDCGMVQERALQSRNFDPFPVKPASVDAVLLTHAHVDHCGLLPKLVKDGFRGRIYATGATAELAKIVLLDAAKVQAEDVAFKKRRHLKQGKLSPHPYEPLYTVEDVETALKLFEPVDFSAVVPLGDGIEARFQVAGHILGAAAIRIEWGSGPDRRSLLVSGDVGRRNMPLVKDPDPFSQADYVICESTYGDREHEPEEAADDELAGVIRDAHRAGGNVVMPSFAVERTQDLLYRISALLRAKKIPPTRVFVDSPMAINVTEVFRRHPELLDEETQARLLKGDTPCSFPGLSMTRTADESKAINGLAGTSIIIAGSGMCTAGRIKHHLRNNLPRPESTILFPGYQANGTLGRILIDGTREVRLFGEIVPVKATIRKLEGMSAHADRVELVQWLSLIKPPPRTLFVIHGESQSAEAFSQYIQDRLGWKTFVPVYKESVALA
jgi:metallo-beta-lactamase family protein